MASFTPEQDRTLHADVLYMSWCPRMDLIALVLANNTLEIRRLSWQRLFDPISIGSITSICWKPDGKTLALGQSDGSARLFSVERGLSLEVAHIHESAITALSWVEDADDVGDLDPLEGSPVSMKYDSRASKCFDDLPSLPKESSSSGANRTTVAKINRGYDPECLDVFISADESGVIQLHAFGILCIAKISVADALCDCWFAPRSNRRGAVSFAISGVEMSRGFRYLTAFIRMQSNRPEQPCVLVKAMFDTGIIRARKHELCFLAVQANHIDFLMKYAGDATDVSCKIWKNARRVFDSKFESLTTLLRDHGESQSLTDSMMSMLVSGSPDQALLQFLSTYLSDPTLNRIYKALESAFEIILDFARNMLERAFEEILFRLTELRGLSLCQKRNDCIGLDVSSLNEIIEQGSFAVMKCEQLQRAVRKIRAQFLHFFEWLSSCVFRLSDEQRQSAAIVTRVDVHQVAAFILNDLQNDRIAVFFENDDLDMSLNSDAESPELPMPIRNWNDHCLRSLRKETNDFQEQWKLFRDVPAQRISRSITLATALPMLRLSRNYPNVAFSLCTQQIQNDAYNHLLAFVIQVAENEDQKILLIRSSIAATEEQSTYQISVFQSEPIQTPVQLGFYNDTHLAVLSRCQQDTASALSLTRLDSNPEIITILATGKEIVGQYIVDVLLRRDLPISMLKSSRERIFPHTNCNGLAVCGPRGMMSVLSGQRRVLIVDAANDEDDNMRDS